MVDEEDGGVEGACQLTQCGENGGDLAGVIFIGALEAYERIKDQQLGALAGERKVEPVQVLGTVKTERGVEDEPDIECGEVGAACVRDALDATFDLMRRVFSREHEHRPGDRGPGSGPNTDDRRRPRPPTPTLKMSCHFWGLPR